MALTTLASGMTYAAFIAALSNNAAYSAYNLSSYTDITIGLTTAQIASAINANNATYAAKYRLSPLLTNIATGMRGSTLLSALNSSYLNMENTAHCKSTKPMFTLKSDDGSNQDYVVGLPYMQGKGLKGYTSMIAADLDTGGYLSSAQALALINSGNWEMGNHSTRDVAHPEYLLAQKQTIEVAIGSGKCKTHSAHGAWDYDCHTFAKPYYLCNMSAQGFNTDQINPEELLSAEIGQTGEWIDIATSPGLARFWATLDLIAAKNGWFIAIIHGWQASTCTFMDSVIAYCATKGISIVGIEEGLSNLVVDTDTWVTPMRQIQANAHWPTSLAIQWTAGLTVAIERSDDGGDTFAEVGRPAAGVGYWRDYGLTSSKDYWYRARAYSGSRYANYSNLLKMTTDAP